MALIKCKECGKEISDKASACPNCGCPTKEKKHGNGNFGVNFWLIICIMTCTLIGIIEIFNLVDIDRNNIRIGNFYFNIVGYLAVLLGFSYVSLMKNKNKISYYVMLGINAVILLFNIFNVTMPITFKSGMAILYIICVIINSLITTLIIRKHLNEDKFIINKNKILIGLFITTLIILLVIECTFKMNFSQTNFRDETVNQVRIVNDYINIRSGNSLDSDVIGKAYKDEIYTILNEEVNENEWLEIETINGIRGYIYALPSYVEILRISGEEENNNNENEDDITEKPNNNNENEDDTTEKPNKNNNNNNSSSKPNNTKPSTNVNNKPNSNKPSEGDNNSGSIVEKPNEDNNSSGNIVDKPSEDNNNSSNEVDKPSEDNKKEEIIDATLEYYCNSPWKLNGTVCEKIEYSGIKAEKTCSFGYTMSEEGTKCIGETRESVDYTPRPVCVGGSITDLFSMTAPPYYGCRKGTLTFERTCPRGYTLVTAMNISRCVWNYTGKETYVSTNCSSSYPVFDKESGECINRTAKSAYTKYVCPDGYTLKVDKCSK